MRCMWKRVLVVILTLVMVLSGDTLVLFAEEMAESEIILSEFSVTPDDAPEDKVDDLIIQEESTDSIEDIPVLDVEENESEIIFEEEMTEQTEWLEETSESFSFSEMDEPETEDFSEEIFEEQTEWLEEATEDPGVISEAAGQVQDMIDVLPSPEDLENAEERDNALADALHAVTVVQEAYEALSEEEKASLDTVRLDELTNYLSGIPMSIEAPPDDDDDEPYIRIDVYSGTRTMNHFLNTGSSAKVPPYSKYYLRAILVSKNIKQDITESCEWQSSDSGHLWVDEDEMIEAAAPISHVVTLTATYKADGKVYGGELYVQIDNEMLIKKASAEKKKILKYMALSFLTYHDTVHHDLDSSLEYGAITDENDQYIIDLKKEKYGPTYASFYNACVSEWLLVDSRHGANGFDASVFYNPNTREYIIAYRGTEPLGFEGDLTEDAKIGTGANSPQIEQAVDYYDEVVKKYGPNITLTGHSLGGALANSVSVLRGVKSYSFDAPSSLASTIVTKTEDFAKNYRGLDNGNGDYLWTDYVNEKDVVGNTGIGDNTYSTISSNAGFAAGVIGVDQPLGGNIDRTVFIQDQSAINGKFLLTALYHGLGQMLAYNISMQCVDIMFGGGTSPTKYCFTVKGPLGGTSYALGSSGGDELLYGSNRAYVFGGSGDDTAKPSADYKKYKKDNDKDAPVVTMCGGPGNDTLIGDTGNGKYLYTKGDGCDTIIDNAGVDGIFIYGYSPDQVKIVMDISGCYMIKANGETIMTLSQKGTGRYNIYVQDIWVDCEYRMIPCVISNIAACPVDMRVYDAEGNVVSELKDGEVKDEVQDYGRFTVEKQGDDYIKTATLYSDDYTVKLFGVGEGVMNYTRDISDDTGNQRLYVKDIPVHVGAVYMASNNQEETVLLRGDLDGDGAEDYKAEYVQAQSVMLDVQQKELGFADTLALHATVMPEGADQEVFWSSSNSNVAYVDENGLVTAVGAGNAEIVAVSAENDTLRAICGVTVSEEILPISKAKVTLEKESYEYTGDPIEPEMTVKYQGMVLSDKLDYTVEYENNVFPGKATVVVTGNGRFSDTVRLEFEIVPVADITVEKKVENLYQQCMDSGAETEDDIALWFHDWLTGNADYDYSYQEYFADGVLLKGKGVCQSYALAFQALLDRADIENVVISAPEMDHAWNAVKINGSWTHIDCTWDDPAYGGLENHNYFGLGDEEMAEDHEWNRDGEYPRCYPIVWSESHNILPNPYSLDKPVAGLDFTFIDASGNVLEREDFPVGNTLLVFGRTTCSNTMSFLREITPFEETIRVNDLNVIVVFEDKEQVAEGSQKIPFTCVYEADSGYGRSELHERLKLPDLYSYPLIVLQNQQGSVFFHSLNYVFDPRRVIATAIQKLPETEEIPSDSLKLYSSDEELEEILREALKNHIEVLKLCNKNTATLDDNDINRIFNLLDIYGPQYDGWCQQYICFGNAFILTFEYENSSEEPVPGHVHQWVEEPEVAATCTTFGSTSWTHCSECGEVLVQPTILPMLPHTVEKDPAVPASCMRKGLTEGSHCKVCKTVIIPQREIPKGDHVWTGWKTTSDATVFKPAERERTCSVCKKTQRKSFGKKRRATITLSAESLSLKIKQSTTKFAVSGMAPGDYVKSWKSNNKNVLKVSGKSDGTCKLTAQKKTGKAVVTITLASGLIRKVTVKVQKAAVKTSKISVKPKKISLKKGKKTTLSVTVTPITSSQKITYTTSNKKIAVVSSKGVITAKKKGTAKITVKSGNKKVVVTVQVK